MTIRSAYMHKYNLISYIWKQCWFSPFFWVWAWARKQTVCVCSKSAQIFWLTDWFLKGSGFMAHRCELIIQFIHPFARIWELKPFSVWHVLKDKMLQFGNVRRAGKEEDNGELQSRWTLRDHFWRRWRNCDEVTDGGDTLPTPKLNMEKGKNSLSPVSHFRHRQVSDPSHGH